MFPAGRRLSTSSLMGTAEPGSSASPPQPLKQVPLPSHSTAGQGPRLSHCRSLGKAQQAQGQATWLISHPISFPNHLSAVIATLGGTSPRTSIPELCREGGLDGDIDLPKFSGCVKKEPGLGPRHPTQSRACAPRPGCAGHSPSRGPWSLRDLSWVADGGKTRSPERQHSGAVSLWTRALALLHSSGSHSPGARWARTTGPLLHTKLGLLNTATCVQNPQVVVKGAGSGGSGTGFKSNLHPIQDV